jgi:predicted lipid-binding transport protein (Tim44 family)
MKTSLILAVTALALGLAATDADARRFGSGGSFGKQRAAPTMREAPKQAQPNQAQPAQAAPANSAAAAPAGAAAKTGFMGRWGGLLAGLGIGAVLASLFGAQLGPIIGLLLAVLLFAGLAMLLIRFLGRNNASPLGAPAERRAQFAGIGSRVPGQEPTQAMAGGGMPVAQTAAPLVPAGFDVQSFERVAKTSFIRLQAANDAKDLDDIRDYTTPEMYGELAMQIAERGDAPQRTEVVSLESKVLEVFEEDGYEYASVRFWGLIRETEAAGPEGFDETWHVRKKMNDRRATWLIAGIQQNA